MEHDYRNINSTVPVYPTASLGADPKTDQAIFMVKIPDQDGLTGDTNNHLTLTVKGSGYPAVVELAADLFGEKMIPNELPWIIARV